jgi:hypothetical protein
LAATIPRAACLAAFLVLGIAHSIHAASVTSAWDRSPNVGVASYVTPASVTGLTYGTVDHFAADGAPSSEVSGQLPAVERLAISCPSPLLTSFDGKAVSVTLTPKVTGEVTPITTTCSPTSGSHNATTA